MAKKIFIDGSAGTTGLRIASRLEARTDIELIHVPEDQRKDSAARKAAFSRADIAFLCLPDDAAREAVAMVGDSDTVLIDTSTAHRVAPGWAYGFPEIGGRRKEIPGAKRIANPGCHASGFISLVAPLVEAGIISPDTFLSCYSLTGYSGGGKKMIAQYEAEGRDPLLAAPRAYGLSQQHKHLPEMAKICGLTVPPFFSPIVAPYYAGMEVCVSLAAEKAAVEAAYEAYYQGCSLVHFVKDVSEEGFLSGAAFAGRDDMEITVSGTDGRLQLVSRFDNLGKGASGAAIQNMNLVLGLPETEGLVTGGEK